MPLQQVLAHYDEMNIKGPLTHLFPGPSQLTFTCSKLTIKTLEKRCEICSKITIKTPERSQSRRSGVFIVNFEHISHLFLAFLLLTLNT